MYRMFLPHLHIPGSKFLFRRDKLELSDLDGYEVVVVQRQVTEGNLKAMQTIREHGLKLIYDLDDNMWNLPAANPAQKFIKEVQGNFAVCAKEANLITVSTKNLEGAVRTAMPGLKQEVLVTPNGIDFDLFYPTELERGDGQVIIGWAGSNTHGDDILQAWGILPEIIEKHSNVCMEFVGMHPPKKLIGHERVSFRTWVPVGEFPNRFAGWAWDISMAPLVDNRFNRSKSSIKMLEAAAVHIPCLASNVQPYYEFCSLGGQELKWLLCDTAHQWKTKLEKLILDADYRHHLGELMYKTAKQYFDLEVLKENWGYALRRAAGWN